MCDLTALGGSADRLVRILVLQLHLQLPVLTHLHHHQAAVTLLLQVQVLAVVLLLVGTLGQALPAVKLLALRVVTVQAQVPLLVAGCSGAEIVLLCHYHTQLICTAVHINCVKTVIVPCSEFSNACRLRMLVGYEWLVEPHLEVHSRLWGAAFLVFLCHATERSDDILLIDVCCFERPILLCVCVELHLNQVLCLL